MTVNGDSRLSDMIEVIHSEMEKLKAIRTVNTPPLKRSLDFNPYIRNGDGTVIQYDFQEVLFSQNTKFQDVKIMKTGNFGSMLVLDDDPNLADSDLSYTKVSLSIT